MRLQVDITIEGGDWTGQDQWRPLIERALAAASARLGLPGEPTELSVVLTNNEAIRALNARWRGKDAPTNVLAFPAFPVTAGDPPGPLLGDIVLAWETVADEAAIDGKRLDAHFTHLTIHGFLHLLGYDHHTDEAAQQMERLERAILADLGIADPYTPILEDQQDDERSTT